MKTLLEAQTAPMSPKQTEYMLNLMMAEMSGKDGDILKDLLAANHFPLQVLEKRLEVYGDKDAQISPGVRVFCSVISDNPAQVVMWAYTLHLLWRRSKKKVDFAAFANAFPWGIPKEDAITPIWDSQKRKPEPGTMNDNLLDDKKTWDEAA